MITPFQLYPCIGFIMPLRFEQHSLSKILVAIALIIIRIDSQPEPVWTDNCITANSVTGTCVVCVEGFYLEYFLCLPCAPLCLCTSQYNYCESCMTLTYKNTSYNLAPYFKQESNRCAFCDQFLPYCLACSSEKICTQCYGGYYPASQFNSNGEVVAANCTNTCQGIYCDICLDATRCSVCAPGYYLNPDTKICLNSTCGFNCAECESASACKVCTPGYFVNTTTNTCQFCNISNCSICANSSYCNNCTPGFYASGGSCTSTGFNNCVGYIGGAAQATGCQICEPGYFFLYSNCFQCVGCDLCSLQFLCLSKCYLNRQLSIMHVLYQFPFMSMVITWFHWYWLALECF